MVLGLIKDYSSKIWEGLKSKGQAVGGFLKEYQQPILGAIEGATGILKNIPHPVVSPIAGIIHTGLKSMKNKVDDVPNEDVKKKLKEIQKDSERPYGLGGRSPEQLTPEKNPDSRTIINPTFDIITKTPSVTVKPKIGAFQHNILKGKVVPYDLMRFSKKHVKQ